MFTQWGGNMDWPLDPDWECEVCGQLGRPWYRVEGQKAWVTTALEWGLIHGLCRCTQCHAKYMMRRGSKRMTKPRLLSSPKYKGVAKHGWELLGVPLDEWTNDMWTAALKVTEVCPDEYQQQIPEPPQEFEPDPMNPCGATDPRF